MIQPQPIRTITPPPPSYVPAASPPVSRNTSTITMTTEEFDAHLASTLENNSSIPTELPTKKALGEYKKLGLMAPQPPYARGHPAIPLLDAYSEHGCPVECGPAWTKQQIIDTINRGPHRSALERKAIIQLREETKDKIKHGYARVVKWKEIKGNIPTELKISPVAMIPHKSKPYRCILDLSFKLRKKGLQYKSVNESTTQKSPPQAMVQLGITLHRIINHMAKHYNPTKPF